MKRIVHGLLAALLIFSSVSAKTFTDKTFLMPRSHNTNIAMEYTTWHKQTALIDKDKFGGTIQATGFYEKSNNKKELGKYFGVSNWFKNCCVESCLIVAPSLTSLMPQTEHLGGNFILHKPTAALADFTLADKICWCPYREAYGIRLDYHQKLDKFLKGLFFKVSLPIVHVKTSLGASSSCCGCDPCGTTCNPCPTTCDPCCDPCGDSCCIGSCTKEKLESATATLGGAEKSVGDYLMGNVTNDFAGAKQVALCKSRFHCGNSETGIADIDIILGYNFLYKPTKHFNVNIGLTIPTGNTPNSDYLWEAVVGNGGHWAFGGGVDAAFQFWKDGDKSLDFLFAFNYRYLFSSTEMRTMGFKWPNGAQLTTDGWAGKKAIYGRYMLGGKKGDTFATPMANFLTRNLKVTPGSHFDGMIDLAFNYKNWTFDVGYNLYAKEAESVKLSCDPCSTDPCASTCDPCGTTCSPCDGWTDDTYAVASDTWVTTNAFAAAYVYANTTDWINREHLCIDDAITPAVVTHKIFGGIGYAFNKWEYPLMLGIGGSYEFATDNDSLECWALWAKIGLTF